MSAVHRGLVAAAAALALIAPSSVAAQWRPSHDRPATPSFVAASPADAAPPSRGDRATLDLTASPFVAPALPGQQRTSRDAALMIVGSAAFLLGAVVGDDAGGVLMVGGAVVGLVGLYQYLR